MCSPEITFPGTNISEMALADTNCRHFSAALFLGQEVVTKYGTRSSRWTSAFVDPQDGGLIWSGERLPFSYWIKLSGYILVSCNIGGTVVRTRYAETCSPGECEKEGASTCHHLLKG